MNKIGFKLKETARKTKLCNFIATACYELSFCFMMMVALCYHLPDYRAALQFTLVMTVFLVAALYFDKKGQNCKKKCKILRRRLIAFEKECLKERRKEAA